MPLSVGWTDWLRATILLLGLANYVAAKAHFWMRFADLGMSGYLAEHWPFWAFGLTHPALMRVLERSST